MFSSLSNFVVLTIVALLLAVPPAVRQKSWWFFVRAAFFSFIGIVVPAIWFTFSAFLVPEWKGGCRFGWWDCFVGGKLWLSPLVLWALCAYYVRVIWAPQSPPRRWIVLGYIVGAVVSGVCLLQGLPIFGNISVFLPMMVPLMVAAYYVRAAIRLQREAPIQPWLLWSTLAGSLPLWAASIWQSIDLYKGLPDEAPSCFIVTAAMGGHERVVDPRFIVRHEGKDRLANRQLATFWALENAWQNQWPASYRGFRRVYNVMGPVVAARLRNAWLADLAYLCLKPLEWGANRLVRKVG